VLVSAAGLVAAIAASGVVWEELLAVALAVAMASAVVEVLALVAATAEASEAVASA
jgi:hypothetical protein